MGDRPRVWDAGRSDRQFVDLLDVAVERANDGIAIMEFTGDAEVPIRIVYANEAIERLSGYTREELLHPSNPFLRVQTQNRTRYEELFLDIKAGKPVRFEIELGGKDRSTWTEIRWSPLRYKDGDVTHYVAVLRDISEARRLTLFQSIVSQTSDFIITADASAPSQGGPKITFANHAFAALVGLEPERVIGRSLVEFFSPRNDHALLTGLVARLEHYSSVSHELQLRRADDGSDRWIELSGHQVRGEGGKMVSWFFIGKDISLRKQSYMQTAQLMTALDLAEEPISIYDVKSTIDVELQHMNAQAASFDRPLLETMLGDSSGRTRIAGVWPLLENGTSVTRLVRVAQSDERRWVTLEIRPMSFEQGTLSSIIAIEHGLQIGGFDGHTDEIAIALALSREIRSYSDLEARRDAFFEVLREEWGARASFQEAGRAEGVVLRSGARSGHAVMPRGVLFSDRRVAVDIAWPEALPAHRLTALRILLETLIRAG